VHKNVGTCNLTTNVLDERRRQYGLLAHADMQASTLAPLSATPLASCVRPARPVRCA
jgi:hypothetical protein